ncbi:NAD-dependent epimerase/dehydratase [Sulfurimonas gotlandica GD1]|uniref:NAD-dependent epimerase/dehydratase n=1 Tax=Sulfurimonas gotlandica (strain DSM 19862 / JCM 16533 / GD1) TaxID=929558 RepID=B6BKH8_SULGG|nr:SDR family oxidoreductase [Sulfurimonas gotlandica]EDZ62255.1 nucleoside-diphosphate-sugar epimerase [Sulfurimonas gotlandica GD1]EHP29033.1 NAD-dependent epimerase/dehydratase [Sulfurimonas gotlandica GD1]
MKKIVITGALGHIGSKLIRTLPIQIEDIEIVMIDNMLSQRYCSLFNLPRKYNYKFIEADILEYDLDSLFKNASYVVHLAAITNAAGSFENEAEVENVNYVGTKKIIDACANNNCKLIFLSTTSIYGTQNDVVDEDCSADELKPQSPYAQSKFKSEQELKKYSDKLDYIILRFGTIFGFSEGIRFHTAVNKFCWQAVMRQPLTVWKTAYNQKRPYLDLEDAVNSIAFLIKNDIFDKNIYNVLTKNLTVKDIVDSIKENVDSLNIDFVETQIMNQLSYDVANEKFKKLGFEFKGDYKKGIKETIDTLKTSNN